MQRWTSSAAAAARWLTSPSASRNLLPASLRHDPESDLVANH